MTKLNRKGIQDAARAVLEQETRGIRWSEILSAVKDRYPETPSNSIHGAIHKLFVDADDIVKIARGIYQLKKYREFDAADYSEDDSVICDTRDPFGSASKLKMQEGDYYGSFAQWLKENEIVTRAIPVGGKILGHKWGTPDVIGVLVAKTEHIIKFDTEITSAEIKIDPTHPVVGFGQAIAYKLFSHRSFIVVPNTVDVSDLERMESLCTIHEVGLVTFELNPDNPKYHTIVPARRTSPDMYYVNEMIDTLRANPGTYFRELFP
jgi:hypothetical protein